MDASCEMAMQGSNQKQQLEALSCFVLSFSPSDLFNRPVFFLLSGPLHFPCSRGYDVRGRGQLWAEPAGDGRCNARWCHARCRMQNREYYIVHIVLCKKAKGRTDRSTQTERVGSPGRALEVGGMVVDWHVGKIAQCLGTVSVAKQGELPIRYSTGYMVLLHRSS